MCVSVVHHYFMNCELLLRTQQKSANAKRKNRNERKNGNMRNTSKRGGWANITSGEPPPPPNPPPVQPQRSAPVGATAGGAGPSPAAPSPAAGPRQGSPQTFRMSAYVNQKNNNFVVFFDFSPLTLSNFFFLT
jgi:hypothetical protein